VATNPRLDELKKRIEREPESRLFAQLAEELRRAGDLAEAIAVARRGLERHPTYVSARITLGRALLDSGDVNTAVTEFGEVVRIAPDNIIACRSLGDGLERLGDVAGALAWYRETLRIAPGDVSSQGKVEELSRRGAGRMAVSGTVQGEGHHLAALAEVAPAEADVSVCGGTALEEGPVPAGEVDENLEFEGAAVTRGVESVYVGEVEGLEYGAMEVAGRGASTGHAGTGAGDAALEVGGGEGSELASPTLAELYYQQGSPDKAAEIYRQLLAREPDNERYRSRLIEIAELQAEMAGGIPAQRRDQVVPVGTGLGRSVAERRVRALEALLGAVRRARA
jgi:tetratricopeptide (TPR) repeat protein